MASTPDLPPKTSTSPSDGGVDIERLKRRPLIAVILVLGSIIVGVGGVMGGLTKILEALDTIAVRIGIVSVPTPIPENFGAKFASIELGPAKVPLAMVAHQFDVPASRFTSEQLDSFGQMVTFTVNTFGLVGTVCQIVWTVFAVDGDSLSIVPDGALWRMSEARAFPVRRYQISADNDTINDEVWIPYGPESERFIAELYLRDANNLKTTLASGRTSEFSAPS